MRNSTQFVKNIDWLLILLYVILAVLGALNIYSSSFDIDHPSLFDSSKEYGKQFMWIGVSLILGIIILFLEGSFIKQFAPHFYGITLLMLVAVLFTDPINGARSWFGVGSFGIQPSEFSKITAALFVAKYLNSINAKMQDFRVSLNTAGILAAPILLILLQPDAGTVLVFTSFVFVLYREGLSGNLLLYGLFVILIALISVYVKDVSFIVPFTSYEAPGKIGVAASLLFLGLFVALIIHYFILKRFQKPAYVRLIFAFVVSLIIVFSVNWAFENVLKQRHRDRIDIFLGLKFDKRSFGYNVYQAKSAIGSGGFNGKGYMNATLANEDQGHVPEQSTDFIFCTLAEEWGLVGSIVLITLFLSLLIRIILIAERQRSRFSRVYGYSVACIIFYHFSINLGMTIGLMPVVGIPLPFFSYGGSSLMAFTILIFILIRLDSERMQVLR